MFYPNLESLVQWHSYSSVTFADHAGVTMELFDAVLAGNEELTDEEFYRISRLVNIPVGLLKHPELQILKRRKCQHHQKIIALADRFNFIQELRSEIGKGDDIDLKDAFRHGHALIKDFERSGEVSYCRYLAVLHRIKWNEWLYFHIDRKKVRGLNKKCPL